MARGSLSIQTEYPIFSVDYAFQRIGGKYKGRILWALSKHLVLRYGELNREMSDINTKMLTQTLKELETDNLIHRKMYPQVPPKVEYSLTETGKELILFIQYSVDWGYKKWQMTHWNNFHFQEHKTAFLFFFM